MSTGGQISVRANTQDTQTVMGGGNITTQCMGAHTEHAGKHVRVGPAGSSLVLPEMPVSDPFKYTQRIMVVNPVDGSAQALPYRIYEAQQPIEKGVSSGGVQAKRHEKDDPVKHTAAVGVRQAWGVEYLSTAAPVQLDHSDQILSGYEP